MHTGTAPTRSPSTAPAPARPGPPGPVSCDSLPLPTERMHIGLLAPPWVPVPPPAYGGTESVVDRLARGLVQAGHGVLLAAAANSTCPVPHIAGTETADGRAPVCGDVSVELRHVITAYDAMRDAGVDVVHDHTLIGPLYRHRDPDLPVVVTAHGPFDASFGPVYRAMHGVPVVAISRHQASTAVGVPLAAVIHHGIDVDDVPVGRGDGGYACFLGRMSPEKGPRQAVLAARAAGVPLRMAAKLREPAERAYFDAEVRPLLGPDVDVVFVTAYDEYSLRAFEVNALDYLLKPVAPERLALTVSRLAAARPPAPARETVTYEDRLFLRLGEERAFVRVRDIVAIEAEGDGSALRLAPRLARKPSAKSLREWEQRLPDRQFVRIHRSAIVNLEYVERLEPWSHASQHVYLRGLPDPLTMSRRFGARLRERFG